MVLNRAIGFLAHSGQCRQQQIAFFQVEASHFPFPKFQGASHNTEVEYITNVGNDRQVTFQKIQLPNVKAFCLDLVGSRTCQDFAKGMTLGNTEVR